MCAIWSSRGHAGKKVTAVTFFRCPTVMNIELNDLLWTFYDDPNNKVKAFTCLPYIDIEGLTLNCQDIKMDSLYFV